MTERDWLDILIALGTILVSVLGASWAAQARNKRLPAQNIKDESEASNASAQAVSLLLAPLNARIQTLEEESVAQASEIKELKAKLEGELIITQRVVLGERPFVRASEVTWAPKNQ